MPPVKAAVGSILRSIGLYGPVAQYWRNARGAIEERKARLRVRNFYRQFVGRGDLCFDIGANIGAKARQFLDAGARVVCVEPQRDCVEELRRTFTGDPRVEIVAKAVGEREGVSEIHLCDQNSLISTMSARWRSDGRFAGAHTWTRAQSVEVTTLDDLVRQFGRPRYCKIDVEGFEEAVLRGLGQPLPFLSFEFSYEFLDDARRCMQHLCTLGNVQFNCAYRDAMHLQNSSWLDSEALLAALQTDPDKLLWGDIYARFPDRDRKA